MTLDKKSIRYFYWMLSAFFKKNLQVITVSFLTGVIGVITVVSLFPYFVKVITSRNIVVGIAGSYDISNVPDTILSKISNSLVFVNEDGDIVPLLAESWEQLEDGRVYRFYLKENLTWGDGKPFTVQDLAYRFQDVEVKKPDEYIIEFHLNEPLPIFPTFLTEPVVKYPLQGVAGLYSVQRVKSDFGQLEEVHLTPNRPNYPIYVYKFYPNETDLINAYKLGEINQMITGKKSIAGLFENWNNTQIDEEVDYTQLLTLFFNMDNPLLQEKDVRKAIAMSIEQEYLRQNGERAYGPIPPTSWAFNAEIKQIQHNPDLATSLMEKYSSGSESAQLRLNTFYDYLSLADTMKESLDSVGIDTDVQVLNAGNFGEYDMLLAAWKVPIDPDQYFFWHSTQERSNIANYKNVKVDKLLEDGRSTLEIDSRKDIYNDFQKVIADEIPAYFLYYPYTYTIKRQ